MFDIVADWMTAAKTAVETALPDAFVTLGPLVATDDIGLRDLVIIGHDDTSETPISFTYEGSRRDVGAGAVPEGEIRVPVTLYSAAATVALDMAGRISAADTFHTAVNGVLMPSGGDSTLGVASIMWVTETAVTGRLIPQQTGPIVCLVCTYTLATIVV